MSNHVGEESLTLLHTDSYRRRTFPVGRDATSLAQIIPTDR